MNGKPDFLIITLVLPPEKGSKYISILGTPHGERWPKEGERWMVLPTSEQVTIKSVERNGTLSMKVQVKGIARKKVKAGFLLLSSRSMPETGTVFTAYVEDKRAYTNRPTTNTQCFLEVDGFPVLGCSKKDGVEVAVTDRTTNKMSRNVLQICSNTPLYLFPFSRAVLKTRDTSDRINIRILIGSGIPKDSFSDYFRKIHGILAKTETKGVPSRELYKAGLSARGWMPRVPPLSDTLTDCVPFSDDRWCVSDIFLEKIRRVLDKVTNVEGGVERERVIKSMDLPEEFTKSILNYFNGKTIFITEGFVVSKMISQSNLSPMSKQLLRQLREEAFSGVSLRNITSSQIREQYNKLVRIGMAVVIGDDILYHRNIYEQAVSRLCGALSHKRALSIGEVKTLFSLSRRYAVLLIEKLAGEGIIERDEESRVTAGLGTKGGEL